MQNLIQRVRAYGKWTKYRQFVLSIAALLLAAALVACGPSAEPAEGEPEVEQVVEPTAAQIPEEAEEDAPADAGQESYPPPPPAIPELDESYPVETLPPPTATPVPDVYPPPTVAEVFAEPRIRLDLPVAVGDATVTGTAPPGLALAVVDVTYNGALLGSGETGSDGRFQIEVDGLIEGNRLGLTFDELEPGMTLADMSIKYYPHRGEGFMNLPNVGVMLDSTLIQP